MSTPQFGAWNDAAEFSAPDLIDCTLDGVAGLPTESHLREWLSLMAPLGVSVVCAGTIAVPSDWRRAEKLCRQRVPGIHLEFNVEPQTCGPHPLMHDRDLWWRVVVRESDTEGALRDFCRRSNNATLVLPGAVGMDPLELSRWVRRAEDWGAARVEFVGSHGCPWGAGVESLVRFAQGLRSQAPGGALRFVWSSVNSLGLGLAQAVHACEAGVCAVRGKFVAGCGSVPLEGLLVHLMLEGLWTHSLRSLAEVSAWLQAELEIDVPANHPVLGSDAFRTASGIHASAIVKAEARARADWMDAVYSAVPAAGVGRSQHIEVGPLSGKANVHHWLTRQGLTASDVLVESMLAAAKLQSHVLSDLELVDLYHTLGASHANCPE